MAIQFPTRKKESRLFPTLVKLSLSFAVVVSLQGSGLVELALGQDQKAKAILSIEQSPKSDILYLGPKKVAKDRIHSAKMESILYGKSHQVAKTSLILGKQSKQETPVPQQLDKNIRVANLRQSDKNNANSLQQVGFKDKNTDSEKQELQIDDNDQLLIQEDQRPIVTVAPKSLSTGKKTITKPASVKRPYAYFPEDTLESFTRPAKINAFSDQDQEKPRNMAGNDWKLKKLSTITLSNEQKGIVPKDLFQQNFPEAKQVGVWPRMEINTTAYWDAPNLCFHRLYTEDPLLERYGQSSCSEFFQVARSTAHFGASAFRAPLLFLKDRRAVRTPIGYHRPGSPVPTMYERIWPAQ